MFLSEMEFGKSKYNIFYLLFWKIFTVKEKWDVCDIYFGTRNRLRDCAYFFHDIIMLNTDKPEKWIKQGNIAVFYSSLETFLSCKYKKNSQKVISSDPLLNEWMPDSQRHY